MADQTNQKKERKKTRANDMRVTHVWWKNDSEREGDREQTKKSQSHNIFVLQWRSKKCSMEAHWKSYITYFKCSEPTANSAPRISLRIVIHTICQPENSQNFYRFYDFIYSFASLIFHASIFVADFFSLSLPPSACVCVCVCVALSHQNRWYARILQ